MYIRFRKLFKFEFIYRIYKKKCYYTESDSVLEYWKIVSIDNYTVCVLFFNSYIFHYKYRICWKQLDNYSIYRRKFTFSNFIACQIIIALIKNLDSFKINDDTLRRNYNKTFKIWSSAFGGLLIFTKCFKYWYIENELFAKCVYF